MIQDQDKQDILDAISLLAENVQEVSDRLSDRLGRVEALMVTKSYLDDKLAGLHGDLIALARKSNTKLSVLVERLVDKGSLKRDAADQILALEPFSQ